MGTKVLVEMDWEQVDEIICSELREHIIMVHKEVVSENHVHPDDKTDAEELLPALLRVYKYWAGEAEVIKVTKELGYETGTAVV